MSHLETERIVKYLAGETDDNESFAVETHLGECPDCLARLRGIELVRRDFDSVWEEWSAQNHAAWARAAADAQAAAATGKPASSALAPPEHQPDKTGVTWAVVEWFGRLFDSPSQRLAWVGIGAIVVCAAAYGLLRPGGVILADAGGTLRVLADGTIRLPAGMRLNEAWQDRLAPVMRGEVLATTPALRARLEALRADVVRLGSSERPAPTPLHPVGAVVRPGPVAFLWRGVEGATNYTLVVSDSAAAVVERNTGSATNVILSPPEVSFAPGTEYAWQVAALVNGDVLGCSPVRFAVLDAASERELAAVEAGAGRSALVMAGVYLHYGLLDEAAGRVEELRRLNPDQTMVAGLERAVVAAREARP